MKKLAFFLAFAFLSLRSFGQFTISPILSLNLSKIKSTNSVLDYASPVLRYALGVQPVYHFNDKMAVGIGLQVTTKGAKDGPGKPNLGVVYSFQYLEASPFFEYRPFKFLAITSGSNIGYFNSLESLYGGHWHKVGNQKLAYKKWNTELSLGLRYNHKGAFVSLQLSQSILPIVEINFTDENGNQLSSLKEYHQSLSLGVGYNFHIKKK